MTDDQGDSTGFGTRSTWHRDVLILAVLLVALSFVLGMSDEGHVAIPVGKIALPSICLWKNATGVDCPGCGLTRCFVAMAHADWKTALHHHPVGMLVFVFTVLQIPYHAIQWRRVALGRSRFHLPKLSIVVVLLLVAMLGQWILKLTGWVVF